MLVYSEVIYSQEVGQPSSPCVSPSPPQPRSSIICHSGATYALLGGSRTLYSASSGGFTTALEAFRETGTRFTGADATQLNLHTKYQV